MYAAKDAGRNAYRFYTADMNARVQQRLQLETDMRRGLMDDEFFLVYQPQIDMQTGRAVRRRGAAALARSRARRHRAVRVHPDRRGVRDDPGARRARAARRLPAGRAVAPARTCCCGSRSTCRCSSCSTTAGCRSSRRRCRVSGLAAALPRPRDHRERDHHAPRKGGRDAGAAEADGRVDHRRRLRHRLLEPVVSRAAADPGREDRPALRPRPRAEPQRRGDHAGDHRAVAFAGPALHRRRRRDAPRSSTSCKRHGCEEAQGFLIARPLEEQELRAWWKRRKATRGVQLQPDLWQPGSD